jgi:hypothetical protein
MRCRGWELHLPTGIAGRDNARSTHLLRPDQPLFDDLRWLATTQAEVRDVDPALDAIVECLHERTELATREDLNDMDFGGGREAANAGAISPDWSARDDARAMRAMTDRIVGPGFQVARDDTMSGSDAMQIAVSWLCRA